jgi:3-isopropylmalate/(R)-2-methylmalate dehydratase small subunit
LKNGMLLIEVDKPVHNELFRIAEETPSAEVAIDLERQELQLPSGRSIGFPIDPFSKKRLLEGLDDLGYILSYAGNIAAYERSRGKL